MDRRQEIESIIIGTILSSHLGESYLESCKSCITADMFRDDRHKRIFATAQRMNKETFCDITPYDIVLFDRNMADIAPYMCELASDYYFEFKKSEYNERQYLNSVERRPKYTSVTFDDYVNRFVKMVFA